MDSILENEDLVSLLLHFHSKNEAQKCSEYHKLCSVKKSIECDFEKEVLNMLGVHHTASSKEWRKAHSKLCSLTQRDVPYITMKVQDEMYVYKGSFFASNEEEIETQIITQKEELEEYEAETSIELQIAYRNKKIQMYSSTLTIDEKTQYSLHFIEAVYTDDDGLNWYNADSYSFNPNRIKCIIDMQQTLVKIVYYNRVNI